MSFLEKSDAAEAGASIAREDEMVEDRAIECLRRRGETTGRPAIRLARPWVSARVIVGEEDAGTAMLGGVGDDIP